MNEAARQGDPIAHSSALGGLFGGLLIGAVVGAGIALATVSTGGLAAVAVVGGAASLGASVGEVIGGLSKFSSNTGQITTGSPDVYTNGRPAVRSSLSTVVCSKRGHGANPVAEGSSKVYINGMPASRVGDHTSCGAKISAGSSNVFIGGQTKATEDIASEVPGWLHTAVFALGLGSGVAAIGRALVMGVGKRVIALGVASGSAWGVGLGALGHWWGGEKYGEGSDEQKLLALGGMLGGAVIGGWATVRGVQWINARRLASARGTGLESGFGNASPKNSVNAVNPRSQLAGEEIANGHAFEKHVIAQAEYKNLGINNRDQFAKHIANVIENPTAIKNLPRGRTAFWDDESGTIVIRDTKSVDGGTAFRPKAGRKYFDNLEAE